MRVVQMKPVRGAGIQYGLPEMIELMYVDTSAVNHGVR
jgi:hypothetical protein